MGTVLDTTRMLIDLGCLAVLLVFACGALRALSPRARAGMGALLLGLLWLDAAAGGHASAEALLFANLAVTLALLVGLDLRRYLPRLPFLLGLVAAGIATTYGAQATYARLPSRSLGPEDVFLVWAGALGLVYGMVEELVKWGAVLLLVPRSRRFRRALDGVVFTMALGLGFGYWENLSYLLWYEEERGAVALALIRVLVPGHAVWGGIMGYYVGLARYARSPEDARWLRLWGLSLAIGMHSLHDFLATIRGPVLLPTALLALEARLLVRMLGVLRRVELERRSPPRLGTSGLPGPENPWSWVLGLPFVHLQRAARAGGEAKPDPEAA